MMGAGDQPRALVTGGAKRVGRVIALALAKAGCAVDVTYRCSADGALETIESLRSLGSGDSRAYALDLEDLSEVEAFASGYASERGSLRVLVHNASSYFSTPMDELRAGDAESFMRVHAVGPLLLTRGVLGALRADGAGSVVAMLDIHAKGQPRSGYSAYAMSKAALHEMVRSLAVELAPSVRVNGVAPGIVQWPDDGPDADAAMQARYLARVPMGRAGTPEEAADAVVWLGLRATYTTGQVIRVDGGRGLR